MPDIHPTLIPRYAKGYGLLDSLRRKVYTIESREVDWNDGGGVNFGAELFIVRPEVLVVAAVCQITQAWNGTGASLRFGPTASPSRHLASTDITEATLGFYGTALSPYLYSSPTSLHLDVTIGTGASTGKAKIWLLYVPPFKG